MVTYILHTAYYPAIKPGNRASQHRAAFRKARIQVGRELD
jgi:hypothetical protein